MTEMRDRDCRSESAYTGIVSRAVDEVSAHPQDDDEYTADLAQRRARRAELERRIQLLIEENRAALEDRQLLVKLAVAERQQWERGFAEIEALKQALAEWQR